MTDLIKRLVVAEVGSRAFDLWIEGAVSGKTGKLVGTTRDVPAYTTSLDAALALAERVLPGLYMWKVEFDDEPTSTPAWAKVYAKRDGQSFAQTPALALCAAILTATDTGRE